MGFLNTPGKVTTGIKYARTLLNLVATEKGKAWADQASVELIEIATKRANDYWDANGTPVSLEQFKEIVDKTEEQLRTGNFGVGDEVLRTLPWPSEPSLRGLSCIEDVLEMPKDKVARFLQGDAVMQYDPKTRERITSLKEKYEQRVAWLYQHNVHRDAKPVEEAPRELTPQEKSRDDVKKRIQAIRDSIQKCTMTSKGQQSYTAWSERLRTRLHNELDDLLRNPDRQEYIDRSRGGLERIRGLEAVERIMRDAIRSADNPIR